MQLWFLFFFIFYLFLIDITFSLSFAKVEDYTQTTWVKFFLTQKKWLPIGATTPNEVADSGPDVVAQGYWTIVSDMDWT